MQEGKEGGNGKEKHLVGVGIEEAKKSRREKGTG